MRACVRAVGINYYRLARVLRRTALYLLLILLLSRSTTLRRPIVLLTRILFRDSALRKALKQ